MSVGLMMQDIHQKFLVPCQGNQMRAILQFSHIHPAAQDKVGLEVLDEDQFKDFSHRVLLDALLKIPQTVKKVCELF